MNPSPGSPVDPSAPSDSQVPLGWVDPQTGDETPFAPLPKHLQPLSKKLTEAAIQLLSYTERDEIHLFETVVGGQRLAIEIAILPRVGRDSAGAMRTVPIRPELPPVVS